MASGLICKYHSSGFNAKSNWIAKEADKGSLPFATSTFRPTGIAKSAGIIFQRPVRKINSCDLWQS
jgi:hypothetical protein